jgi:ribosomal protein L24
MNNNEAHTFRVNDTVIVLRGSLKNQTGDILIIDNDKKRAYVSFITVGIGQVWIPLNNMQIR